MYLSKQDNITWFEGLFDKVVFKKLSNKEECRLPRIKVPVKIETIATYKKAIDLMTLLSAMEQGLKNCMTLKTTTVSGT